MLEDHITMRKNERRWVTYERVYSRIKNICLSTTHTPSHTHTLSHTHISVNIEGGIHKEMIVELLLRKCRNIFPGVILNKNLFWDLCVRVYVCVCELTHKYIHSTNIHLTIWFETVKNDLQIDGCGYIYICIYIYIYYSQ